MRHLLPLLPIVLLAACDDYALEEQWAELERAEVRWERAGIDDYAFTMFYHCECLVSGEFAIVGHGDSITSAKRCPTGCGPVRKCIVCDCPSARASGWHGCIPAARSSISKWKATPCKWRSAFRPTIGRDFRRSELI